MESNVPRMTTDQLMNVLVILAGAGTLGDVQKALAAATIILTELVRREKDMDEAVDEAVEDGAQIVFTPDGSDPEQAKDPSNILSFKLPDGSDPEEAS